MLVVQEIENLIVPVLRQNDFELVETQYRRESGRWILRIFVDKLPFEGKERKVTLEDCEKVSRMVSLMLDGSDVLLDSYDLEVSSPGINRVLKSETQFNRFVGSKVRISLYSPLSEESKQRNFSGPLLKCENEEVEMEDVVSGRVRIPLSAIQKAHLDII